MTDGQITISTATTAAPSGAWGRRQLQAETELCLPTLSFGIWTEVRMGEPCSFQKKRGSCLVWHRLWTRGGRTSSRIPYMAVRSAGVVHSGPRR